ncbi:hypothetical protein QCA50_020244 [Cerrena zonata]|uniref:Uncharacterized protein n=1 Tax=Cerrena zonata TaxID=2478898 RepID=A0AAW0F9T4_9APHY
MKFDDHVLPAAPRTDFWHKPPAVNSVNAPVHHLTSIHTKEFQSARVTVSADWTRLYDQGGLFIYFPEIPTLSKRRWLKTGIEFYHGKPNLSTVASREWSDWSLNKIEGHSITIEVDREKEDLEKGFGSSLFVYRVVDGVRDEVPIREVTWAFEVEGEMQVGVYAARPIHTGDNDEEKLDVALTNFVVEKRKD